MRPALAYQRRRLRVTQSNREPLAGAKLPDTGETDETAGTKRETKEHVRALQITDETPGNELLIRRFRVRIPGGAHHKGLVS